MIQRNNNLSVLPFYGSIEEQNHRKSYAYGEIYPLYVPVNNVPPFQVVIAHTDATISSVQLYTSKGVYVSTITAFLTAKGLTKYPFAGEGYDVLVYPALASETTATIAEGQYYLTITMSDDSVLYSDIFTCAGMI